MDTWHERRPYVQMFHPRYMHVRIHTNNSEVYILLLYMHIYIDAWDIYICKVQMPGVLSRSSVIPALNRGLPSRDAPSLFPALS